MPSKPERSAGVEALEEQFATHLDAVQHVRWTAGTKRGAEDHVMVSPAKRAHTVPFLLTQAPVAFGHWMESDAGPRRCNENQHAV